MSGISDRIFGIHDDALVLRSRRADVLASNLANADTPGYKARDLDFSQVLRGATGTAQGPALQRTHAGHLPAAGADPYGAQTRFRNPSQPSLDGNTVDAEVEQVKFMENAVQYQTTLSFLSSRVKSITAALKGE